MEVIKQTLMMLGCLSYFVCAKENIALGKDTRQSSTLSHHKYPLSAKYANDGLLDQTIKVRQELFCSHTLQNEPEYWWAIDFGRFYYIESVTIYNRVDCCSDKLYNFSIFTYNPIQPSWATFNSDKIFCHFYTGQSPDILNLSCDKKTGGRYLQIHKDYRKVTGDDVLSLCEVEVYTHSQKPVTKFCKEGRKRPITRLDDHLNVGKLQCVSLCNKHVSCLGFESNPDNKCKLYQTSMTVETVDDNSYYFEKC